MYTYTQNFVYKIFCVKNVLFCIQTILKKTSHETSQDKPQGIHAGITPERYPGVPQNKQNKSCCVKTKTKNIYKIMYVTKKMYKK